MTESDTAKPKAIKLPRAKALPKKPKAPRQTVAVFFRLDSVLHAKLVVDAELAGVTVRVWLEKAILENKTEVITKERPGLRALLYQVNRAGNNINQIAKSLNIMQMSGDILHEEFISSLEKIEEVSALMREAIQYAG